MRTIFVERNALADIAVFGQDIERTITLGLKVTPLALQLAQQILLIALVKFAGAIRTTGYSSLAQQFGFIVYRYLKAGILNTIKVALKVIGTLFFVVVLNRYKSHAFKCRYKRRIGTLQRCIHHGDTLRIIDGLSTNHQRRHKRYNQ